MTSKNPQEPRRLRFWRAVLDLAQRRVREAWMEYRRHDRMCPHCGRWGAETGGWAKKEPSDHPMVDWLQCSGCGQWSAWFEDMVPEPVDPATLTPVLSFEDARAIRLRNPPPIR